MSRNRNKDPRQKDLFNVNLHFHVSPPARHEFAGTQQELSSFEMGMCQVLKAVLDDCAKREREPLDRQEVASRMSRKLGRDITKTHIDGWVAMSQVERRIHVDSLKALCEVTGDWRPLHYMNESCGFKALDTQMAACAEYGAKVALIDQLTKEAKSAKSMMDNSELLKRLITGLTDKVEV